MLKWGTPMAEANADNRRHAVRPRDRVMTHLRAVGEVTDPDGLASTALSSAVGYTGSSVAFAQLLSAMEHSGLIEREIRGRRTYCIRLAGDAHRADTGLPVACVAQDAAARDAAARDAAADVRPADGAGLGAAARAAAFDYDELARRLLAEVVRQLAAGRAGAAGADLATTVASLERKLASVQSRQRKLQTENTRLREMLSSAERSLAEHERRAAHDTEAGPAALDEGTVQVLERLLSSLPRDAADTGSAQAG